MTKETLIMARHDQEDDTLTVEPELFRRFRELCLEEQSITVLEGIEQLMRTAVKTGRVDK